MTADADVRLVRMEVTAGVATITLDSPSNRNALSGRLRTELLEALTAAENDSAVRVIVLAHTGPTFCAGADLKETRTADPGTAAGELVAILSTMMAASTPIVASVGGPARAGGIGLLAASDFVVADQAATFAFSEVRIGVIPAIISVPLQEVVSRIDLRRLFLTGEVFDADHARSIGLVSHVAATDSLPETTEGLASSILRGAPTALAGVKKITRPAQTELAASFAEMQKVTTQYFSSPDAQEGMRAFAEKRAPGWVPIRGAVQ